jgi:hypothetical protein
VPATGARTSPAVRVTDSGEGGAADGREGASSSATTTRETTKESTRTSGRDDVSATSATHASSRTLTRDGPPATTATTAPVLRGLDRMADGLTTTIDQPIARSVTAADAVRLRRLIRQTSNGDTDFVADVDNAEFVADVDNADIVADVDNAVVRPAGPILDQGLPAGEHDVAIATLPTEARPERVMTRRATNLTPHDVLRRVSLPRAMSRRDRPVSSLTAAVMRRRHEATRTRHSPDRKATISRGGQTSPTPGADVRPPATGRSQAGADPADRGVPQRWDISAAPTSHASTAPPTAPTSNPSTSRPSTTNSSTAAPFSPTRAPSASSRDETSAAASVLRRAIAGDMSQAPVQPASVRPPTPSTSAELSTFSAAVDHRHVVTERAHEVAASLIAGEPIHWPSPGTMFAPATFERRAADAGVSSGARRSVVAPGPGALRSVLRNIDATADEASPITHPEAVRDASRNASTRGRPITAPAAAAARPSRTERAPETFTDIVTSHRDDGHRDATHTDAAPGSAVGPPIVRTAAPKKDQVAARFLTELSRGERSQPQPLPAPYRPMAEAITGHHRVLISTDDASRRALRAVNKIAATTGDVIHLAAPPAVGLRHAELLAHELTHVAHPSPAPRFFADDDRGPEERRADEIARVIARSPLAPTASIGRRAAASTGPTSGDVIRRAPVSRSTRGRPSDAGTTSAAALAEQITRGATTSSSSTHTIRRFDDMPPLPPIPPPNTAPSLATTSTAASGNLAPGSEAFWKQVESTEAGSDWFRSQLQANFDRIVRLLERHMIGELERRGGRNWKGY